MMKKNGSLLIWAMIACGFMAVSILAIQMGETILVRMQTSYINELKVYYGAYSGLVLAKKNVSSIPIYTGSFDKSVLYSQSPLNQNLILNSAIEHIIISVYQTEKGRIILIGNYSLSGNGHISYTKIIKL